MISHGIALVHNPKWHGVITLNLLEFLGSAVSIYMNIKQLGHGSHVLAFTYIPSSIRWMIKVSFDPVNEGVQNTVA